MMAGDFSAVAKAALTEGEAALSRYDVQLFRPVQPMLAQSAEATSDAIADLGEAALEFKLDGARIQVHKSGDDVRVYSRQLNDVTAAVPEIVESVLRASGKRSNSRWRSPQLAARRSPAAVPSHNAAIRTQTRCGSNADKICRFSRSGSTLLYLDGGSVMDETQAKRFETLRQLTGDASVVPAHDITHDPRVSRSLSSGSNRARTRRDHGEGA